MIGIATGEEYIALEFSPIFASDKMKWAKVVIKTRLVNKTGEYGFAFTSRKEICIYWGLEMHFRNPLKFFRKC